MKVDELAARVRNHAASEWNGEDSPEDVIRTLLTQELERVNDESARNEEAAQKRAELHADLGLGDDEEKPTEETADGLTARQRELQSDILGR